MTHLTVALSDDAMAAVVATAAVAIGTVPVFGEQATPRYQATCDIAYHLQGGTVTARQAPTITVGDQTISLDSGAAVVVEDLDIVFDEFLLDLTIDLPPVCVGGQSIQVPTPAGSISVTLPTWCAFGSDPDLVLHLDLSGLTSELAGAFGIQAKLRKAGDGLPELLGELLAAPMEENIIEYLAPALQDIYDGIEANAMHAEADRWALHLVTEWLDIDLVDLADSFATAFDGALAAAVQAAVAALPPSGRDLLTQTIGDPTEFVRRTLDLPDETDQWLSELTGVSVGLRDLLVASVSAFYGHLCPLHVLPARFPLTGADPEQPLAVVRIAAVHPHVADGEVVLMVDLGSVEDGP
jgi:hypothetical protein